MTFKKLYSRENNGLRTIGVIKMKSTDISFEILRDTENKMSKTQVSTKYSKMAFLSIIERELIVNGYKKID